VQNFLVLVNPDFMFMLASLICPLNILLGILTIIRSVRLLGTVSQRFIVTKESSSVYPGTWEGVSSWNLTTDATNRCIFFRDMILYFCFCIFICKQNKKIAVLVKKVHGIFISAA